MSEGKTDPGQLDLTGRPEGAEAYLRPEREEVEEAYEEAVHELAEAQVGNELHRGRKLGRLEMLRELRDRFRGNGDGSDER